MFEAAKEIQHTIIDVIIVAESLPVTSRGYDATPDLSPSDLWQRSEKIRKHATFCMGELVLRIKARRTSQSSHGNNASKFQAPANPSPPLHPNSHNNAPILQNYHFGPDVPRRDYYQPPAGYPAKDAPQYTPPEHNQYTAPRYHKPQYIETPITQSHWRTPSQPTPPLSPYPDVPMMLERGLPSSLRVGPPVGQPLPIQRQRPASVSISGTGYISRVANSSPYPDQPVQRQYESAPLIRPGVHEGTSYGFQEERGTPDTRRATVGYTKPPRFDSRPEEQAWIPNLNSTPPYFDSRPQEQPWIPNLALYSPVSPPTDFLDVSTNGHFRMPTPLNHGGQEFHQGNELLRNWGA